MNIPKYEGSIEERFKNLIADHAGCLPTEFANDTLLENLGLDSLDEITVLMDIENEFGIEISDEEAKDISTVGEAINLITEKVKS